MFQQWITSNVNDINNILSSDDTWEDSVLLFDTFQLTSMN